MFGAKFALSDSIEIDKLAQLIMKCCNILIQLIFVYRRKVPRVLVNATIRRTPCAVVVADPPTTSRSPLAPNVATPQPSCVHVSSPTFHLPPLLYTNTNYVSILLDNWSVKAKRRKTTGTGRMSYLKVVRRRFRNGFREGTQAKPKKAQSSKQALS